MQRSAAILLLIFQINFLFCQQTNSSLIDSLIKSSPELAVIASNAKKYRVQIIYTQINRDKENKPSFTQHNYFLDSTNYFYCASLVKLPCSILALQKINELKIDGLTKESRMLTDSTIACHKRVKTDTSSATGFPSVAHYIKKMLLVSDNLAYGRTYEFLTPDYIHNELSERGYGSMRIVHRFDGGCSGKDNLLTNPVSFYDGSGKIIYQQPETQSMKEYKNPLGNISVGRAHIGKGGKKISKGKDFTNYNFMHLQQTNDLLKWLVFADDAPKEKKFNVSDSDRKFLLSYSCLYPRESDRPRYNPSEYHDSYKKYFLYGDSKKPVTDTNVRIFNIVGQSYGFMVDCAYIVDFNEKTEFMLSAVIYTNANEVINDGKYEYRSVALPYLSALGKKFLEFERKRKRRFIPSLEEFKPENLSSR